ncbi:MULTISPECIES: ribbon-helix-helix protein, CopG family [unclassified Novosphingobium]|uniref:ribbon-helix-helix protein, CopG family n=1 Tax=unclassified Novosphingobium TaxID=2644732 RepID=UPI000D3176EE
MTSTKKVLPKKKGRPATGKDPVLTFRSPPELTAQVEAYAEAANMPRSEAIRRLVEAGLSRDGG